MAPTIQGIELVKTEQYAENVLDSNRITTRACLPERERGRYESPKTVRHMNLNLGNSHAVYINSPYLAHLLSIPSTKKIIAPGLQPMDFTKQPTI